MTTHDVISAFLDNEPFDPRDLGAALADPDGRGLLLDLIALRQIAQPDEAVLAISGAPRPSKAALWIAAAAASAVIAAVSGYQFGARREALASAPPTPTVIIQTTQWRDVTSGGER